MGKIRNWFYHRNLNKADAILLAQRKTAIKAEDAKAKQAEAGKKNLEAYKNGVSSIQMDKTKEPPIDTRKEIAKTAGVSGKITPVDNFSVTLHTRAR